MAQVAAEKKTPHAAVWRKEGNCFCCWVKSRVCILFLANSVIRFSKRVGSHSEIVGVAIEKLKTYILSDFIKEAFYFKIKYA